jgi:Tfp pilus assembly protein PilV
MSSHTRPGGISGFALAEALVALLLLAFAMLGAGVALVESLAGQRMALQRTLAADLASNLGEALRSAPEPATAAAEIRSWQAAAQLLLPQAEAVVLQRPATEAALPASLLPAGIEIRLQWRDGAPRPPAQLLLPLGLGIPPGGS